GSRKPVGPSWQIQTAKARFSEVFRRARTEGPQLITRQGKEGVVMISDVQYEQLVGRSHQPKSIVQFFRESPLVGVDLNLEREKDEGRREIERREEICWKQTASTCMYDVRKCSESNKACNGSQDSARIVMTWTAVQPR